MTELSTRSELDRLRERVRELERRELQSNRTERTLRETIATLAHAEEIAGTGGFVWQPRDDSAVWSHNLHAITGMDPEQAPDQMMAALARLVHPEDLDRVMRETLESVRDRRPRSLEFRLVQPGGGERIVTTNARYVLDDEGEVDFVSGTLIDITERRRAERRFQQLFEHMQDGAAVYRAVDHGADFVFVDLNRAGEAIEQIRRADVIGRRVTECFPGIEEFGLLEVFRRVWRTGEPEHSPVAHYQDQRITGWRNNFVFRLESGELVAVYSDETQAKRTEAELEREREKLRSLVAQLAATEERERQRLAALLHDEVTQLLAAGTLQLDALAELAGPELIPTLTELRELCGRAVDATRDLTVELSPPILRQLGLEPALAWLGEQSARKHALQAHFTSDGADKPLTDEAQALMFTAARELLHNVVKHAGPEATARIDFSRTGNDVVLNVADDGAGMESQSALLAAEGYGLFSITQRVESLGGKLGIDSEPGRGTRVTVTLPVAV